MINPTAFIIESYEIPWALILMAAAVLLWPFFSSAMYAGKGRQTITVWLTFPVALLLALFFSRSVYWYSHQSQFDGYVNALKSLDLSAFSLLGVLPGIVIAASLMRLLGMDKSLPVFLDSLSPATAASIALLYLTCLFHPSCRGKMIIENPEFQRLPFAYLNYNTLGESEYRLAVFFFGFMIMTILSIATIVFYCFNKKKKGYTACFFVLFYSAAEFVIESTRYDAGFFPANGFVSIIQIFSAVCIFAVMVYYTVSRIINKQWRKTTFLFWLGQLASMGATGFLEYYVQRHGSMSLLLHPLMCLSCFLMALFPVLMGNFKTKSKRKNNSQNTGK